MGAEFIAPMEDVLDLYAEPYDPAHPTVCFDESPKQLVGEVTPAIPPQPGQTKKEDVEYERKGVRDIMMICEPKIGRREVLITEHRTKQDFAHCMNHIFDMYPDATKIRVVMDNLNTHTKAALYEAFPAEKARQIARKLEFHYTPKHGSWLNIAEIELAVLSNTCIGGRIPDEETLRKQINANIAERNDKKIPVKWRFSTQDARRKLARLYPVVPA